MNSRNERGFTLVELSVVVAIIGILSVVTAFGVGCVVNDIRYSDRSVELGQVHRSVTAYYKSRGELPVGDAVSSDQVSEFGNLKKLMGSEWGITDSDMEYLFDSGSVYELLGGVLRFDGDVSPDVYTDYVVILVDDFSEGEDPRLTNLRKFNGSVLLKDSVRNCDDVALVIRLGNEKKDGVSDALKFNVDRDYINCPNKSLCERLKD